MAYYLTKPFQKNQMYDLLTGKHFRQPVSMFGNWYDFIREMTEFNRIVSLDIGHEWTRAWLYEKGETNWTGKALKLDTEGHICIPTRISYDYEDNPPVEVELIGYEADPIASLQRFKTPHQNWDKTSSDGIHTFKHLMSDFIQCLWFVSIRDNNPDSGLTDDDWEQTLLVIGCPFSNLWT